MTGLAAAVDQVLEFQTSSDKPLGIILAGHNGSGKSTMWRKHLSDHFQMPLVNADRMMLSILPEPDPPGGPLVEWARELRDTDEAWMRVAQKGVESFVAQALIQQVPFAMETVFSDWHTRPDGTIRSKIELIQQMQAAGYFVLLFFVGLSNPALSTGRVLSRVHEGGHAVDYDKLVTRFPRTQQAIGVARGVADAAIMVDNSLTEERAFDTCRIQLGEAELFDLRGEGEVEPAILEWLDVVAPR
jgi:predicted ABC-type ATPase